jgi:hypothetical protein
MSQGNIGTKTIGSRTRILNWNRGVVDARIDDTELRGSVDTGEQGSFSSNNLAHWLCEEPGRHAPMTVVQPGGIPAIRECMYALL